MWQKSTVEKEKNVWGLRSEVIDSTWSTDVAVSDSDLRPRWSSAQTWQNNNNSISGAVVQRVDWQQSSVLPKTTSLILCQTLNASTFRWLLLHLCKSDPLQPNVEHLSEITHNRRCVMALYFYTATINRWDGTEWNALKTSCWEKVCFFNGSIWLILNQCDP